MKHKIILAAKFISALLICILLIFAIVNTKPWYLKLVIVPFFCCSLALIGQYFCLLVDRFEYLSIFRRVYIVSFLTYAVGFFCFWCYYNFVNGNYLLLLVALPFFFIIINLVKKYHKK